MKCEKCSTPGCNQWTIVLDIKARCDIYLLDPNKVKTFQYDPGINQASIHEDCHCDDWKAAFQDVINQVASSKYSSKADCQAAKGRIKIEQMIDTQIAPSQKHVDPKWGQAPANPKARCYATFKGSV